MTTTRPERDDKVSLEKFSHEWIHDQRKGGQPQVPVRLLLRMVDPLLRAHRETRLAAP